MEVGIMTSKQRQPQSFEYEGLPDRYQPSIEGEEDAQRRKYFPYIPDSKLVKAVNLAIKLNRPLLLEGEPGCGKTRLADAIAYEFTEKYLQGQTDDKGKKVWWSYYAWNVKSVGQARDGLYSFDAVARLRDSQLIGADPQRLEKYLGKDEYEKLKERLLDKKKYVKLGKLGEALAQQEVERPIVLIDEIDKADSDFPNDLLVELDRLSFEIPETDEIYPKPDAEMRPKPIVIITSNQERPLPEPFLRRCLYYYLSFPSERQLKEIVLKRFGTKAKQKQKLIDATIAHFQKIRELLESQPGSKLPGTSELLDFLDILKDGTIKRGMEDLQGLADNPHLLGIILKTQADQELYRQNHQRLPELD
jgi:MoxR-like ATPase